MKKILYIAAAILIAACSNQEKPKQPSADGGWDVTITGQVKFPGNGKVSIQELTPNDNPYKDSIAVASDGSFTKTLHIKEPGYYQVNFYDKQLVNLMVDKTNFQLNVDGSDPDGQFDVVGSPDYDVVKTIQQEEQKFRTGASMRQLEMEFQAARTSQQDDRIKAIQDRYMDMLTQNHDSLIVKLRTVPVNLGLINALQGQTFDKDRYFEFYKEVADKASKEFPNSIHFKQFVEMVTRMAVTAIGQKAPEISLPDPQGKTVTLSSFQGKYVLVDFWAKWCGPCRKENPNVVKAYKKYKNSGFEILGVSLDRTKEDWVQAIQQDGLTWTQVSDLKYFESKAAMDYNINAIPFSILIDPNGVIIAKNLRGSALDKKLDEVLKKKS